MNKSIFLIIAGLILIVGGISLIRFNNLFVAGIPVALGILYIYAGFKPSQNKRIMIVLKYGYLPLLVILLMIFDEYLTSLPRDAIEKSFRTFWYSGSGVCTERTFCWILGQFLIALAAFISFIVGVIRFITVNKSSDTIKKINKFILFTIAIIVIRLILFFFRV